MRNVHWSLILAKQCLDFNYVFVRNYLFIMLYLTYCEASDFLYTFFEMKVLRFKYFQAPN